MMNNKSIHTQNGFALLLTLVVVSVVLAIGLSLLDITLKQLVLSGTGRDSEIAFQAAYSGRDCGNYWAKVKRDTIIGGSNTTLDWCIGTVTDLGYSNMGTGNNVHKSSYEITWGATNNKRCTEIDIYIYDASSEDPNTGSPVTFDITAYGNGDTESCDAGNICTIVFSRGYNRGCGDTSDLRTIQREIVSQF